MSALAGGRLAVIVAALLLGYGPVSLALGRVARRLTRPAERLAGWRPHAEAAADVVSHLLVLGVAAGLGVLTPSLVRGPLALVPFGLVLGPAEAGAALLAATVMADLAGAVRQRRRVVASAGLAGAGSAEAGTHWLCLLRSGWAGRTRQLTGGGRRASGVIFLIISVATEEAVFRGAVLTALRPAGVLIAVLMSAALYSGYAASRPQARGAVRDTTVACAVIGLVNGLVFAAVPGLLPLIVAQLSCCLFLT
jgi:hypothetical protein